MIEGFKVDVTADELIRLFDARIAHHREAAEDCDRRRVRIEAGITSHDEDDTDEQLAVAWAGYPESLERSAARHRDQAATLTFLREHVVAHEIYRLGEPDLRALQLWPLRDRTRTSRNAE